MQAQNAELLRAAGAVMVFLDATTGNPDEPLLRREQARMASDRWPRIATRFERLYEQRLPFYRMPTSG